MTSGSRTDARSEGYAPVAVIDIGSNSVRLVVYEGAVRSPSSLFNEKVLCGLGRTLASTGRLDEEGIARTLRALRRFRALSRRLGAESLHVIATAAAREAENGPEFIARAERVCETKIAVLSGRQEAELAASGVIAGNHEVDGLAADLGGGSLEIIDIRERKLVGGATLPLGGLRLIDESGGDPEEAARLIDAALGNVDWLPHGEGRPFYAVGGTWRAFARLHMAQTRYPLRVMHGYSIPVSEALDFARVLDHLSSSSLAGVGEIASARRETVPYGALVLERLLSRIRPSRFVVSAFGVREGLLYELLTETERKRDPLLAACEDLARQRARSPGYAEELFAWTEPLFSGPDGAETAEQRRMRHAACLLADIGWRGHPEYRGEQSLNLIAHAAFAGIDHPGRAFLALTVFYRHQGRIDTEASPRLKELVDAEAYARARILGAAMRAAHMISASMTGVILRTPVSREGDRLVLSLPESLAVLDGERLERRFEILAGELGLTAEIRTGAGAPGDLERVSS